MGVFVCDCTPEIRSFSLRLNAHNSKAQFFQAVTRMNIYKLNCMVYANKYKSMEQVAPDKGKREGFWEEKTISQNCQHSHRQCY